MAGKLENQILSLCAVVGCPGAKIKDGPSIIQNLPSRDQVPGAVTRSPRLGGAATAEVQVHTDLQPILFQTPGGLTFSRRIRSSEVTKDTA